MNKIELSKLEISNFKGIKNLTLDFSGQVNVFGKNGSGKSSIYDAYCWLLFGKNSQNESSFSIKPFDSINKVIHNLESTVVGLFIVDGVEMSIKRVLREKWTKKRGSESTELTGNETIFFINDVPKTLTEYKLTIDAMISEESQRILSNTLYFNQTLDWKQRRFILTKLSGDVSDENVLGSFDEKNVLLLRGLLNSGKCLEDYKKEYSSKRKKLKDELDFIPSRIDEASKNIPKVKDWGFIKSQIDTKTEEIKSIDSKIEDKTKLVEGEFEKINKIKTNKFELSQKLQQLIEVRNSSSIKKLAESKNLKAELNHSIYLAESGVKNDTEKIKSSTNIISECNTSISKIDNDRQLLLEKFKDESEIVFSFDENLSCPTCLRLFDTDKIVEEKLKASNNFIENKNKDLLVIQNKGKLIKVEKENLSVRIKEHTELIEGLNVKINNSKIEITSKNNTLKNVLLEIESFSNVETVPTSEELELDLEIKSIIVPKVEPVNVSELKDEKQIIVFDLKILEQELFTKTQIETQQARVLELESSQKLISQEIANLEKVEMLIEKFTRAKIDKMEQIVNQKFKGIKFVMFEEQMNKGIAEVCYATVNGVPFSDLNTASRINAGLEVINVLSDYYELNIPVFIDNRESVSDIIETKSQVINLIVDPKSETLNVK